LKTVQKLAPTQLGFDSIRAQELLSQSQSIDSQGLATGQHRAQNAFKLFSKSQCQGQNLFLLSYPTIDTKGLIKELITSHPHNDNVVFDLVYVEDLNNPRRPICLQLPKGQGLKFSRLVSSWLKRNDKTLELATNTLAGSGKGESDNEEPNREETSSVAPTAAQQPASDSAAPVIGRYTQSIDHLLKVFKRLPKVVSYLTDLAKRLDRGALLSHPVLANSFVAHNDNQPLPIIYCDNPDSIKLFGDIAIVTEQGSTVANHHLLQPGLLHRANGGIIVLPAERLLEAPQLWFELKSALLDQQIKWISANAWLDPEPVDLKLQIVLVGDSLSYKLFLELDPDIMQLFPLIAEVNHQIAIGQDQDLLDYAGYLQNLARRADCHDLSIAAIVRLMELSSTMVEHQHKFSLDSASFTQLIQQAQTHIDDGTQTERQHIETAINDYNSRKDRIACYSFDAIKQQQLIIETQGKKIGQINGLSVLETDLDAFGEPSRITAAVYVGDGDVDDVERKVDLAGNIHAKGVAILTSYLHQKFALEEEIPLSANLVFEQSYQGIDGDSAALASLICLLSAFSKQPLLQGIALTGAIDQFGNVLAVGGINEKIDGYFKTCALNPLDGNQGVIIPASNCFNLNLGQPVIDAVAAGNFTIYAIDHVDQAIQLCFELPAGVLDKDGNFDPKSLYGLIQQRIEQIHNPDLGEHSWFEKVKNWLN